MKRELRSYKDKEGRTQVTMAASEAPEDYLCDFCSSQERPFKRFMCNDFEAEDGINSLGAWLACPTCTDMIDARDQESLLARSSTLLIEDPNVPHWFYVQQLRSLHAKFFRNLISDS
jgi:hypothetical protein